MKTTEFRCDQCEKYFPEDQMTATGGDEIYCQKCWPEKVEEAEEEDIDPQPSLLDVKAYPTLNALFGRYDDDDEKI